ncbi:hypothetical protein LCGC14_2354230 [marine sediment metagenome]|uniref:Uncharacterized protein n=1 Tax=marine sediment metagenome TaxID=412755 RepID=A0A0F9CVU8_9ZZZZ
METEEWFVSDRGGGGFQLRYGTEDTEDGSRGYASFLYRDDGVVEFACQIAALLNAAETTPPTLDPGNANANCSCGLVDMVEDSVLMDAVDVAGKRHTRQVCEGRLQ